MVLVRGDREGNEIKIKNHLGAQCLEMIAEARFEEATGGPVGYCGPVGTKCAARARRSSRCKGRDELGRRRATRRDTHLDGANPGPRFPRAGVRRLHDRRRRRSLPALRTPLEIYRGIEVGHVFKLGTKYSEAMHCTSSTRAASAQPMIMGCYGLGIGRTVAAAIEQNHDDDGIIWPMPIAPFEVVVTLDRQGRERAAPRPTTIYEQLLRRGHRRALRRPRRASRREVQGRGPDRLPAAHRRRREEPGQRPDRVELPQGSREAARRAG